MIPFGLVLLEPSRTSEARDLIEKMREHAAYFEQGAKWATSLPADLLASLPAGDLAKFAQLPPDQQEQIRKAALAIRVAGKGLPWVEGHPAGDH
jgi:hypothetical protein